MQPLPYKPVIKKGGKRVRTRPTSTKPFGGQKGRRATLNGQSLPKYPERDQMLRRSAERPMPTLTELCGALAAPSTNDFATMWLQRLSVRDTARFRAISEAWAKGGRSALVGVHFTSALPCKKCGGTERIALSGRCAPCYKETRFTAERKRTEKEMHTAAVKQAEKRSAEYLAGTPTTLLLHTNRASHWMASVGPDGVAFLHTRKTYGNPYQYENFTPAAFAELLRTDAEFQAVHAWACNNAPVPEGYAESTLNPQP